MAKQKAVKSPEFKKVLSALSESEKRFRLIVEQAGDAFFVHDYSGRILDVNRQACESLGYSREELLDMNIMDVDVEADEKKHQIHFWKKLSASQYVTFEGRHLTKDGKEIPVEVRLGRLDVGGESVLLSLVRDITERKKTEAALTQSYEEIKLLKEQLEQENVFLRKEIELTSRHESIIGESDAIRHSLSQAQKVAVQDTCVLILGETGTGKELLAHAIHKMSPRKERSMIKVNCAALPATLIESELFGHEKGAFTHAFQRKLGKFELADKGTLFLDEVGDLPLELQAKLLRALQEGEIERLGSTKPTQVDVRIITATNRDLQQLVREGTFRNDLYYRLNVFPITIPSLRDRFEDIPLIASSFVKEFAESMGKPIPAIGKKTMDWLIRYPWPGNIRELRNVIERAMIMTSGSVIYIDRMDFADSTGELKLSLDEVNRAHILKILEKTKWRVSGKNGAADILGLKPTTLEARMKKLDIRRPK